MATRKKPTSASNDAAMAALRRENAEMLAKMAAMQAQLAAAGRPAPPPSPATTVNTDGGTGIAGSVQVEGGHFIGRDLKVQIFQTLQPGEDPAEAQRMLGHYLATLATDLAGLPLGAFNTSVDKSRHGALQLADVYVPLDTTTRRPKKLSLTRWLDRPFDANLPHADPDKSVAVSALDALAHHRQLVLLGQPGSGKSTLGAHLLLALAQALQGHTDELKQLGTDWKHGALLPLRIKLRALAQYVAGCERSGHEPVLWQFVRQELDAAGLCTGTAPLLQRLVRDRGALWLFDGLDECGDEVLRQRVLDLVRTTIRLAPPACRFLLTARPYAWPDAADARQGVYQLAELTEPQIEQFITRWYAAMQRHRWCPPDDADAKRDDLLQAYQRDELLPLARNPLLLTQMAMLHSNRGRLPEDRAELYHESVELLLQRWTGRIDADRALLDELKVPGLRMSDLRTALEELAYLVHAANAGNSGTADIGEDLMRRHFRPLLGGSLDKAQRVLDYIDQRAGLLIGQDPRAGERQFSFPHRSFQEFLAACHLAARGDFESACVELARQAPGHWQVVLPLAARRAGRDRGASAADALVHGRPVDDFRRGTRPEPADWTGALLAGWQLLEIGPGVLRASERGTAIADRVAGWLAAALPLHPVHDGGAPARQRVQAASVLARLGDPRFDPARLHLPADPMLGFVRVSADPAYCIGTRRADAQRVRKIIGGEVPERELNDDAVACPEFLIGRHLVTTAQFQAYVQATGRQPGDPGALRGAPHEPVRRVSWHEALDYCRWLGERLAAGVELADRPPAGLLRRPGLRTTLPSELEWERAARAGRPGAVFPWGDDNDPDMANTAEAELGAVSPVGCFLPNGFGLHDMVGNVWEWTRSLWGDDDSKPTFGYPYLPDDPARENPDAGDKTYRVVRGGAFSDHRDGARCACRLRNHPGCRDDRLGFRVVLREAPVFEPPGAGRSGL